MVLSQGEFSKLLQAPRNERNRLLEDITGANSYRNIGIAVFQRFAKVRDQIKMKKALMDGVHLLAEEILAEKKKRLENLRKEKPKAQKAYEAQREQIQIKEDLSAAEKEHDFLRQKEATLQEHLKGFEDQRQALAIHERRIPYLAECHTLDQLEIDVKRVAMP